MKISVRTAVISGAALIVAVTAGTLILKQTNVIFTPASHTEPEVAVTTTTETLPLVVTEPSTTAPISGTSAPAAPKTSQPSSSAEIAELQKQVDELQKAKVDKTPSTTGRPATTTTVRPTTTTTSTALRTPITEPCGQQYCS